VLASPSFPPPHPKNACLQRPTGPDQRAPPLPRGAAHEYRYMTEFQSHEPEFDYLKSLEIEEKIDKVRWCRSSNNARMLLSTNDKTVKLWKVSEGNLQRCHLLASFSYQLDSAHPSIIIHCVQVYDKKVSNLTNFNLEGGHSSGPSNGNTPAVRSPLWSNPKVAQLRMPQVCMHMCMCMCMCMCTILCL